MTIYASLDDLLKPHCPEEDIELPTIGKLRVRALSRAEQRTINTIAAENKETDPQLAEVQALAWCIVKPDFGSELSDAMDKVRAWRKAAGNAEVQLVVDKIVDLGETSDDEKAEIAARFPGGLEPDAETPGDDGLRDASASDGSVPTAG